MIKKTIKLFFYNVLVLVTGGLLFVWLGIYNIAANEKHWDITTELLEIFRERSIEAHSDSLIVPKNISSKDFISSGVINYAEMCTQCHLSPGIKSSELNDGLYPRPPIFHQRNNIEHDPKEMFWVIKNGIKLTGMPAWGSSHTDEQIWEMVAFILVIDKMSVNDYKKLTSANEHQSSTSSHHQ